MSIEENKALVRRYMDDLNKRNLAVIDELYDVNYMGHVAGMEDLHGPEEMKQMMTGFLIAFPDLHRAIEDMVAEGDKVVVRLTVTGTHKGDFQGIAPTGKQATVTVIAILRIVGGKIVETWELIDMLGVMQQIGAIPTPGQG